jgi:hypothetical protein
VPRLWTAQPTVAVLDRRLQYLFKAFFQTVPQVEATSAGDHIEEIILVVGMSDIALPNVDAYTYQVFLGKLNHRLGDVKPKEFNTWVYLMDFE